ncbi:MAG: hypothetical protein IGR92_00935 [Leptolyngbyaceae cyanobacterium T60_A2020_046]|nr:hypothetical protein [Leptolyngbyaceae cyanobacterium T60_A2020_046]
MDESSTTPASLPHDGQANLTSASPAGQRVRRLLRIFWLALALAIASVLLWAAPAIAASLACYFT